MLASALRRDVGDRALDDLQKRLLDTLAGDIAGDGGVLRLAGDLVDLVDIDDAALGQLHVEIRSLQKSEQDVFDVLAHIAGLGQRGRVRDGERHIQDLGQRLGEQRLAGAGGADEQNVALLQLHVGVVLEINALIVVIDRHRQGDFCVVLTDDIVVHVGLDLLRRGERVGQFKLLLVQAVVHLIVQDGRAELDAFIADVDIGTGDDAADLLLFFAAEGAADGVSCQAGLLLSGIIVSCR